LNEWLDARVMEAWADQALPRSKERKMNNKQVLAALEMTPSQRFQVWMSHCREVTDGYDKLDSRLLAKVNEDLCNALQQTVHLRHAIEQAQREGLSLGKEVALEKCVHLIIEHHKAHGVDEEVTDKLLALVQPPEERPVVLPDFKPVVAGGYG
jgi:hypothetical protein